MDDREVEAVSIEVVRIENVAPEVVEAVFAEYQEMTLAQDYLSHGGKKFAREALVEALGRDRAEDLMMRIEAATEVSAFQQLHTVDIEQFTSFIQ